MSLSQQRKRRWRQYQKLFQEWNFYWFFSDTFLENLKWLILLNQEDPLLWFIKNSNFFLSLKVWFKVDSDARPPSQFIQNRLKSENDRVVWDIWYWKIMRSKSKWIKCTKQFLMFILFSLFICFKNNFTPTLCIHSIMAGASFIMTR